MTGRSPKAVRRTQGVRVLTLLAVDNVPLRDAAWERLQLARKRLTKATAELHRHEQQDTPAYRSWMMASCPALLSEIRDLTSQCERKAGLIADVEAHARRTGKPAAVIWQLFKEQIPSAEKQDEAEEELLSDEEQEEDEIDQHATDQIIEEFLRDEGIDPLGPEAEMMRDLGQTFRRRPPPEPIGQAKEIYRRLVQRLHPDRGGEWSAEREALWHEVQRAWEALDADWLARLEAELEIAGATLSSTSELGRLYAAQKQIEAARRDTERKLRQYRKTPAWRFTLDPRPPRALEKLVASLEDERDRLVGHLAHLETIFARWEKPLGQARAKQRHAAKLHLSRRTTRPLAAGKDQLETKQDR